MARLPSERFIINQMHAGLVTLYEEYTEEEIVSFDPSDADKTAKAQAAIHFSALLSDEDKCFAHFWSGYFHAHAVRIDL